MRTTTSRLICSTILAVTGGCGGGKSANDCSTNSGCKPGEVCISSRCATICTKDADCGGNNDCTNGAICQNQVCVTGCRGGQPVIGAVNGDGSADTGAVDPRGQRTANHLRTKVVVSGTGLEGATVVLTGGGNSAELTIVASTETSIEALVPTTLAAGQYTLRVTNAVGADQAEVWVLQGEQGPAGAAPSESEIQAALAGVSSLGCTDCVHSDSLGDDSVTPDKLAPALVHVGGNFLPNPYFARMSGVNPSEWIVAATGAAPTYAIKDVSSDGIAGPFAMENGESTRLTMSSGVRVVVDRNARYQVVGSLRRSRVSGSVGGAVLGVRLFDASGVEILNTGEWWFVAASAVPGDTWVRWEAMFGSGTSQAFPANARTMDVAVRLNDDVGSAGNQYFEVQGLGLYLVAGRSCPPDMADAGDYCIDKTPNAAADWQAQASVCQQEGKQMCSMAQWIAACNARATIGMTVNLSGGPFEYVDEYWVMNYYSGGQYYSAYVSVGSTACGRIYYSGWACSAATCYDTTNPGGAYASRCCKSK